MYYEFVDIFRYLSPAIVVGAVSYIFWLMHFKNEERRRNYTLAKDSQKVTIPIRLQAYERLTLLLERVNPKNIILRHKVDPSSVSLESFREVLIESINQEFNHNVVQQLYVSSELWDRIIEAKIMCINMINIVFEDAVKKDNPIHSFKNAIFELCLKNNEDPTRKALDSLKKEVQRLYTI